MTTATPTPLAATPTETDFSLLRKFQSTHDSAAFAQIVQRYASCVYSTCLRVLGDTARADEASQETFFRLMRRPDEINTNLGGWLHRTATHVALDALRSDTARHKREIVYTKQCQQHESESWAELSPCVDQALTELPEELRQILIGHYLLGKTQAQLSEETNLSPATISRRVQQGLDELRKRLRLKGVYALPAALAALFSHVAARQAPASLVRELGKMTMLSSAGRSATIPQGHRYQPQSRSAPYSNVFRWNILIPLAGAILAIAAMFFVMNTSSPSRWNWSNQSPPADFPQHAPSPAQPR